MKYTMNAFQDDEESVTTGVDQNESWEGTEQDSTTGGVPQDDIVLEGND